MFFHKVLFVFTLAFSGWSLSACDNPEQKEEKYLSRGDSFFEKQDYARARLAYKNAARFSPTDPRVLYSLGLVDEAQGNLRGAMAAYMVAEQQDPDFEPAVSKLAQYFLAAQQYDEVRRRVERILSLDPKNAGAHALSASLLLEQKYFEEAKDEVRLAFEGDPDNVIAFSVLTGIHVAQGLLDEAQETLDKGIARNPEALPLFLLKAAVYSEQNDMQKIAQTYERIFLLRPEDIRLRIDLARILSEAGDKKEAEAALRAAVVRFPDNTEIKRRLSMFLEEERGMSVAEQEIRSYIEAAPEQKILYLWLADLYIKHDLIDQAVATLEEVIGGQVEDGISLNASTSLASIQLNQGDAALAAKLIEAVLAKDINNTDALFVRASLAFFKGDDQRAVSDLRTVVRNNPRATKAFRVLAETLLRQGHLDLAIDTLRQSLDVDPGDLQTHVRLAQLYVIQGDAGRARNLLSLVTTADPAYPVGWESRARLAIETKDWAAAEQAIQKLDSLEGQALLAAFLRAQIQSGRGEKEAAVALYKHVIERDPSAPLSEHALSALLVLSEDLGNLPDTINYIGSLESKSAAVSTVLGKLLMMRGKTAAAEEAFNAAVALEPHTQAPFLSLAEIFRARGENGKAIGILREAEKAVPSDIKASMMMADILSSQGRIAETIEIYEALLASNASLDVVANNLAQTLADFQNNDRAAMERARMMAERFMTSDNPFFLDTLGWVYFRQGNIAQARPLFDRVVARLDPLPPQIQYHYGALLLESGEKQKAREMLLQSVKAGKPFTGYDEAMALLKGLE